MTAKTQNLTSLVLSSPPVSPRFREFGSCTSPKPWKRVLGSRASLNTDVSCVTYFCFPKDNMKAKNYSVLIRRSKSLPCDLQKEGLSNVDCRRKLMELLRRQKTIPSTHEFTRIEYESKDDVYSSGSGIFECETYALGMSRDFTECGELDESQNSQEQFRAPTPLDIVRMNSEMTTFGDDLTEDNIARAFNLSSTQSCEHLNRSQKNAYKIQKWLQRCVYEEPDDVTNV